MTVAEPEADPGCEISVVEDAETVADPTAAAVEPASSHAVKPVGAVLTNEPRKFAVVETLLSCV